jgi:Ca2+-transporting ATPase
LIGQTAVMGTIGLLSGVGLWLLGIDAAFALGLMGGLMGFIPFVEAINIALVLHGLLQGGVVMLAALGIFELGISDAHGEEVARCMSFVTLVLGNLGLVLTNRSMTSGAVRALIKPNAALAVVMAMTLAALSLAVWVPWARGLFSFAPLGWARLGEAAGAALVCVVINDLIGIAWRRLFPARREPLAPSPALKRFG